MVMMPRRAAMLPAQTLDSKCLGADSRLSTRLAEGVSRLFKSLTSLVESEKKEVSALANMAASASNKNTHNNAIQYAARNE